MAYDFNRSEGRRASVVSDGGSSAGGVSCAAKSGGLGKIVQFPWGTDLIELQAHSAAGGALAVQYGLCPHLSVIRTITNGLSWNDYSKQANDDQLVAGSVVPMSSFPTAANGGFLYVGAKQSFRALNVDVNQVNGTASVMTVKYWNGSAWTAVSGFTDGTIAAGASLGQDGSITYTMPTDWVPVSIKASGQHAGIQPGVMTEEPMYWLQITFGAALDAACDLYRISAFPRSALGAELGVVSNQTVPKEELIGRGYNHAVGLEVSTDQGTARLNVQCFTNSPRGFIDP